MLPPDAFVDAPEGDLYLDKITERESGTYRCTVQNLVGMEDCELILKITSPSTVTDGHGPTAGTTAEITAGVGMKDCEPVLNITTPSTVIDGHGPTAGTTAGAIVAVIVVITLRCEEEDNPYERTETTDPVLSSSAEDNEKNASIEEGLTACDEAKARRQLSKDEFGWVVAAMCHDVATAEKYDCALPFIKEAVEVCSLRMKALIEETEDPHPASTSDSGGEEPMYADSTDSVSELSEGEKELMKMRRRLFGAAGREEKQRKEGQGSEG
ncbi:hypothetical protein ABVT39_020374 [Epinephelus coioides]